jgi:dephospho-CoA kinase
MVVVGVTGRIGAGKSTLCRLLRRRGALVIDADAIGRRLLRRGRPASREIAAAFGPGVLGPGGEIDRARLARRAFADDRNAAKLDAISGPRIVEALRLAVRRRDRGGFRGVLVVDAALLLEWEPRRWIDCIVLVEAPRDERRRRATAAGRMTPGDFDKRDRRQARRSAKVADVDVVLYNEAGPRDLERKAGLLWRTLVGWRAPRPRRMSVPMRKTEDP